MDGRREILVMLYEKADIMSNRDKGDGVVDTLQSVQLVQLVCTIVRLVLGDERMDNLSYLSRLGWGRWSTPYSRDRQVNSVEALGIINDIVDFVTYGRKSIRFPRPRVIVVGVQGSGKSSVLESFIGTGFLPKYLAPPPSSGMFKGDGVDVEVEVENKLRTVCPVVINLVKVEPVEGVRHTAWVEFDHHVPRRKFLDFEEVEKEIGERMKQLVASGGGGGGDIFSDKEVILSYHSSLVVNMSLIDLPGVDLLSTQVKSVVDGRVLESSDCDDGIQRLVMKYMCQLDTLILAVTKANCSEISSCSVFDFVKRVDPLQKRTLAIVSHWDKLSDTVEGRKIVLGKKFKMDLGVVGIRNRSQEEILKKTPIQSSQVEGEHFTLNHYKELTSVLTGVGVGPRYLVERVCELVIFLWGSKIEANIVEKHKILEYMKSKIANREEMLEMNFPNSSGLEMTIKYLKFVTAVIEKDWKNFGIEGSATRHRQLSAQYSFP